MRIFILSPYNNWCSSLCGNLEMTVQSLWFISVLELNMRFPAQQGKRFSYFLTTAVHVTIGLHHPNNNTKGQTEEF